jgi:hypothetical protein
MSTLSDTDLLSATGRKLGTSAEELMLRYYRSSEDAHVELQDTGRLQASFARLLRRKLDSPQKPAG